MRPGTTVTPRAKALLRASITGVALLTVVAACSPRVEHRGVMVDPEVLSQVRPGMSTRDDVLYLLGSPSTQSSFQGPVWYYIGQRTEQTAFFHPEVKERNVVEIRFDDTGSVEEVQQYDLEDGQEIELVERETPTEGRDISLFQQLFGNLGRFNTEGQN